MQFLFPSFLWALAALAIPVIIHLFNFRRHKTIYFSNVAFLKEVKEETAARSKLKHLLVLAARCLVITFLVLAFAQPFIPKRNTNIAAGKKYVSVYVDNSFSMGSLNNGVPLLDKAKQAAKEITRNFAADDLFQLITNDFSGKHQRLVSREEFLNLLEEIELSPAVRNLQAVTKRQNDMLMRDNSRNRIAYLLSDFQKNAGTFLPDSMVTYNLVPLQAGQAANVFVDTLWFYEPVQLLNQQNKLIVKLRNAGESSLDNGRLLMKINGQTKAITDFSIPAGSFRFDTIHFTLTQAGWNKMELSLQDFPITYDDVYYASFYVADKMDVLCISENGSNAFIDALFKNQVEVNYRHAAIGSLNYSHVNGNQLVVLANLRTVSSGLAATLQNFLKQGGAVAIFPSAQADIDAYNRLLNALGASSISGLINEPQEVMNINWQSQIFRDVLERKSDNLALPKVKKYYAISGTATSQEESLITLKNRQTLIARFPAQAGVLYLSAVPLDKDFSELPIHSLFAPMLYKMAVLNMRGAKLAYVLGEKESIEITSRSKSGEAIYRMKGNSIDFIPEQYSLGNKVLLNAKDQVKKAGFYEVTLDKSDSADVVALNFNRSESVLQFYATDQLRTLLPQSNVNIVTNGGKEVVQAIAELDRGTALWKWMVIMALLFLAAEVVLLRFWK